MVRLLWYTNFGIAMEEIPYILAWPCQLNDMRHFIISLQKFNYLSEILLYSFCTIDTPPNCSGRRSNQILFPRVETWLLTKTQNREYEDLIEQSSLCAC